LEPFPTTYEFAKKNIEANGFGDTIAIINGGIGKVDSKILIPAQITSTGGMNAKDYNTGTQVEIFTLETIMKRFNLEPSSILKIYCEGCEYDIFDNTKDKILLRFKYIIIEYHHGRSGLDIKLKNLGFLVKIKSKTKNVGDIIAIK
jgi:FkbM family methyltransferase